jgi:hypothetical protein
MVVNTIHIDCCKTLIHSVWMKTAIRKRFCRSTEHWSWS